MTSSSRYAIAIAIGLEVVIGVDEDDEIESDEIENDETENDATTTEVGLETGTSHHHELRQIHCGDAAVLAVVDDDQ